LRQLMTAMSLLLVLLVGVLADSAISSDCSSRRLKVRITSASGPIESERNASHMDYNERFSAESDRNRIGVTP
jgi:hypothetical protein